ncbi:hypothetical protein D6D12_04215 [Aureobasidium pullulans]|uniref:F-box domain-containing protein n=1 Tax=Aureobasidium pullulans TaxID=5580 RepID=A0AB74JWL7_AURPU|nr:hypothetical protein D6D12_04215 [Aureobasidium pullulans]THX42852.1 hypothetical protein D6D11_08181 [Aureobasidium pullulans]THX95772.1 hypothetical protein D6D08_01114 [Aureobasidium pullulans]
MSSINQLTGPSASTVAMSARQEFTPEQLERIKRVVDCLVTSSGLERTPGSTVIDFLHTQDLMSTRTGPITPVKQSPPISFLDLPAEVRNKIYRRCLVVGKVFPRRKALADRRIACFKEYRAPQTQLFLVCRQIFRESAPMYFGLNNFVISYGGPYEWPWHDPLELWNNPVSSSAYQHLRHLSISFDARDHNSIYFLFGKDSLSNRWTEAKLTASWQSRQKIMEALSLEVLEVSFATCDCYKCGQRLVTKAVELLFDNVTTSAKMILSGFVTQKEADEIRTMIEDEIGWDTEDKDPTQPEMIVI